MKYTDILHKTAEDSDATKKEPHTLRNVGIGTVGTALAGAGAYTGYQALDTLRGLKALARQKDTPVWVTREHTPWAIFDEIGAVPIGGKLSVREAREMYADSRTAYKKALNDMMRRNGRPPEAAKRQISYKYADDVKNTGQRFSIAYAPYKQQARALLAAHPKMLKLFKMLKLR